MNILGISAFYHDSAACLIQDGQILAAAQEERFTRIKHDHAFPQNAIDFCLKSAGLTGAELDFIAFYDKPFLKFERILETYMTFAPLGIRSFIKAIPLWIKKKLWIKELIRTEFQCDCPIFFPEHHASHAASAFFPSPFQEAAFLTIDGVGEWTTTSWGVGENNQFHIIADIRFPHSIGLLYSAFTYYTGFRVNSGEYKLMGLAPYGAPKYTQVILDELIDLKPDGSFKLNLDYFAYCVGLVMTSARFHHLFGGPPRKPESNLTQKDVDLARSLQDVIDEVLLRMARHIRQETGKKHLCLAGGVALNCVANGKLQRANIFEDIWIQPAAGDAGGALGAAFLVWYQHLGKARKADDKTDAMQGAYLGPEYKNDAIKTFLDHKAIPFHFLETEAIPAKICQLIDRGKVIGWFQGRMEFGPRALGARSIIGDARSPAMQETMNRKIKFRESFRPFAPSVLADKAAAYFDLDRPSPYMLLVAPVQKQRQKEMTEAEKNLFGIDKLKVNRSDIPAITHVDYSARIQTVHQETNPLFYNLISRFNADFGCAVIINTSFNVRGEPIVCSPEDAYLCFMRTQMDFLLLGNYLLDKQEQTPLKNDVDWQKKFELD